jgi:hypothetical protein
MHKEIKKLLSEHECKLIEKILKNNKGVIRKDVNCQMDTDFTSNQIKQLDVFLGMFLYFMCKETNLELSPSYSYARIYRKGSELHPHVDRKGSEYALTINISQSEPWDIYMNDKPIRQNIGDGLIYKGCELKHSRTPYIGDEYIQLMLFYTQTCNNAFDSICKFRNITKLQNTGPILIDDVFAVNEECSVEVIDENIVVINDMFKDWTKVRDVYINAPAFNWKMPEGTRNFIDYYDCRHHFIHHQRYPFVDTVCKILEHVHKKKFKGILGENNAMRTNWFKQIKPKTSDWSQIHQDGYTPEEYTMITFLNTEEESSGGTSLFKTMNKRDMDGHTGGDYWSKVPKEKLGKIINIEMKPNKTIIFKSDIPHAAWHPIDSFYDFPRHNIVFRIESETKISIHVNLNNIKV